MRKNILQMVLLSLFFFANTVFALPQTFTLDPNHTYVLWHISHLGFSSQSGKWYATGTMTLDKDHPQNSKVNASIQINTIVTGLPALDEHLMGPLFFDVQHFPTATFVSNKVAITGKDTANVTGILTLHGVAKPVVLNVKLNQAAMNPISNNLTAGFSATTQIKRSDFGMDTLSPALGDEVQLEIEAEAVQAKK